MTPHDSFNLRIDKPAFGSQGQRQHTLGQLGVNSIVKLARDVPGRIEMYSGRRDTMLGRAMALLQVARDRGEDLPPDSLKYTGAWSQTIDGTRDTLIADGGQALKVEWDACHTMSGSLKSGAQPLSIAVRNLALKRFVTMIFGDCMLMPKAVNRADVRTDNLYGIDSLVSAANLILSDKAVTARKAVQFFFDDATARLHALNLRRPADCVDYLLRKGAPGRGAEDAAQSTALAALTITSHTMNVFAAKIPEIDMANHERLMRNKAEEAESVMRSKAQKAESASAES